MVIVKLSDDGSCRPSDEFITPITNLIVRACNNDINQMNQHALDYINTRINDVLDMGNPNYHIVASLRYMCGHDNNTDTHVDVVFTIRRVDSTKMCLTFTYVVYDGDQCDLALNNVQW